MGVGAHLREAREYAVAAAAVGILALITAGRYDGGALVAELWCCVGGAGAFVLARRMGLAYMAQLVALVGYFFTGPLFAGADSGEIVRAAAWMPWIVWCCSPYFPWKRRWTVAVAAAICGVGAVTAYPGAVAAWVYSLPLAVIAFQWLLRPRVRDYVVPMAISVGVAAAGYVAVAVAAGNSWSGADVADTSRFPPRMIATFFFRHTTDFLPNDLPYRSFFLPASLIALVAMVGLWRRAMVPYFALLAAAGAFGIPLMPWYEATAGLPGMALSDSRMAAFRIPLLCALVMMAAIQASRLAQGGAAGLTRGARAVSVAGLAATVAVAGVGAIRYTVFFPWWLMPWMLVILSAGALAWAMMSQGRLASRGRQVVAVMLALAVVSGVEWAYSTVEIIQMVAAPAQETPADLTESGWRV
jgi:hypothetical protein